MPSPTAILFDLDGTLIDSIELIVRSFQHCTKVHLGKPRERELIVAIIGLSLIDELERAGPGKGGEMIVTYRTFYAAHHDALIGEYDGVQAMLGGLSARCLPMGIVTAKSRTAAEPSFRRFGLPEQMQTIVSFEDTERHKPHPEPLLLAAARLHVEPQVCWYVGDSTHDMQAARAAGMTAVGAAWGPYGREALTPLADYILDHPGDLLELLDRSSRLGIALP